MSITWHSATTWPAGSSLHLRFCNSHSLAYVTAVLQFFLSPLLLWHSFLANSLSVALYAAALGYYHYMNFLGYSALPFLEHTEVMHTHTTLTFWVLKASWWKCIRRYNDQIIKLLLKIINAVAVTACAQPHWLLHGSLHWEPLLDAKPCWVRLGCTCMSIQKQPCRNMLFSDVTCVLPHAESITAARPPTYKQLRAREHTCKHARAHKHACVHVRSHKHTNADTMKVRSRHLHGDHYSGCWCPSVLAAAVLATKEHDVLLQFWPLLCRWNIRLHPVRPLCTKAAAS